MRFKALAPAAVVAAVVSACGGSGTHTTTTTVNSSPRTTPATTTVTRTVTTTSLTTPAATTTSPAPSTTTATATCTPRQLGIHYVNSRGAAGTAYEEFAFVNVSSSPCVLEGYPGVSIVLSSGKVDDVTNTRDPARTPKRVTVAPGGEASFVVGVHGDAAHPCVQATHFRFIPPGGTAYEQIAQSQQVCGGDVVVFPVGYGNA